MPKNCKGFDPLGFLNTQSVVNIKEIEGGKILFTEKNLTVPKTTERMNPLVSPGMVSYAGKEEKLFWFSSLDQVVNFDAIVFW